MRVRVEEEGWERLWQRTSHPLVPASSQLCLPLAVPTRLLCPFPCLDPRPPPPSRAPPQGTLTWYNTGSLGGGGETRLTARMKLDKDNVQQPTIMLSKNWDLDM